MLTKFAVKNYRGFADWINLDLSNPSSYAFNVDSIKNGTIKNGIIYGANGSGKTNIGLAIFDIANHLSHKWKKPDYYLNYADLKAEDNKLTQSLNGTWDFNFSVNVKSRPEQFYQVDLIGITV